MEKMVISTSGSFVTSENREGSPWEVKITPKVEGSARQASVKLTESPVLVTPRGIPRSAVMTMPMRIAPFTLHRRSTIVSTRPMRNSQKEG